MVMVTGAWTEGQRWYREVYLKSPYWKATAEYFRRLRCHRCEKCNVAGVILDVHHNGYGEGYHDENGQSLLWRERARPAQIQVLCRYCHDRAEGVPLFPYVPVEPLEPWVTEEEERLESLQERGLDPDEDDEAAQEEAEWEMMYDMGLDPDDPDFSELAAEGLEGDPDGNYDDERDDYEEEL